MKPTIQGVAVVIVTVWALYGLREPRFKSEFDLVGFGHLPVIVNGRLQPLESAARNALLIIRGKQTALTERRERLSAVEWLLTVTASPEVADRLPVFRVDHPELRSMLNLPANGSFNIAFRDIASHLETIQQHAERAGKTEPKDRTAFERAVVRLATGIAVYNKLKSSFRPDKSTNLVEELRHYEQAVAEGVAAWKARQNNLPYDEQTLRRLHDHLRHFESVIGSDHMLVVPPSNPSGGIHGWQTFGEALLGMLSTTNTPKPLLTYATLVTARMNNQPEIFNTALRDYRVWLNTLHPKLVFKCNLEYAYRNWQPFLKCMTLYGLGLLISLVGWYVWFKPLNSTAFWIAVCGFALHSAGIALRMAIEGRPPVTNLYSSAVFVGWGAAALGLVLERVHRDGLGLLLSTTIGLITLVIAHNLALRGDTMEALRAVLDSNFWLATHVITITLGYSAMFVAGFIGIVHVLRGMFTRSLDHGCQQRLARMAYGTICFATFFSFTGTVLGGIWADQSWGRFWGWDPKENGALLVVLWCAIALHARASGMVGERGFLNLAVVGNVVTAFSWFGVNMLGVGLHAYGFMERGTLWLAAFMAAQFVVIGLGLLPTRYWASFKNQQSPEATRDITGTQQSPEGTKWG